MRKYHFTTSALLGLSLVVLAGLAPEAADVPIAPGMARVWFLRPAGSANGNVWAAAPMIYANAAPVSDIPAGTEFYRDVRPGTYSFTVQSYGLPTGQADTVQLAPGTQTISKSSGWPAGRRVIRRRVGGLRPIPSVS